MLPAQVLLGMLEGARVGERALYAALTRSISHVRRSQPSRNQGTVVVLMMEYMLNQAKARLLLGCCSGQATVTAKFHRQGGRSRE